MGASQATARIQRQQARRAAEALDLLSVRPGRWYSAAPAPPLKDTAVKPLNPASAFALFAPSGYNSFFTNALLIIPIARLNISLSAGEGVVSQAAL